MINYNNKIFNHDKNYTIGVEEEYMICCPKTGELIDKADEILNCADDVFIKYILRLNPIQRFVKLV